MKLAIVNQRYGLEVNGGSEYYTRLLAEHLSKYHEVEILTTKALEHDTWKNVYEADEETIHGIKVRRFAVEKERTNRFVWVDKIRYKLPWKSSLIEKLWIKEQGPYTPALIDYIKQHKDAYDLFIFVTYLYYPAVAGIDVVRDKAILIPTAHDEPYIYMNSYKKNFTQVAGLLYLTQEEETFVQQLFHNENVPSEVAAIGVDVPQDVSAERFRGKYHIQGPYIIYVGRVEESKGCAEMFRYFTQTDYDVDLVVMGKNHMLSEIPDDERIHMLGFVSEEDKMDAISGSLALVLPSHYESLSISVLEALALGTPVMVNGTCEVLKGHCERAGAGMCFYDSKGFAQCIDIYQKCDREKMAVRAKKYIAENYTWEKVEKRVNEFFVKVKMSGHN